MAKNPLGRRAHRGSLKDQLKDKSRRRRDTLDDLAAPAAAPRARRNDLRPTLELVEVPINVLRYPARRLTKVDPALVAEVAGSISELGDIMPILIGRDNLVLDGRVRVDAAKLLGLDTIRCIRVDHLSEAEQRLATLALNRMAEKRTWDLAELKLEFDELVLLRRPDRDLRLLARRRSTISGWLSPAASARSARLLLTGMPRRSRVRAIWCVWERTASSAATPPIPPSWSVCCRAPRRCGCS